MLSVKQKLFLARVANRVLRVMRRLVGLSMCTRCRRHSILWDLDLDEGIDLAIYLQGAYEPGTLRAFESVIRPGDTVFDIGANIGAHTLHFARLVGPAGAVYAFEPTDYAVKKLHANLALNPMLASRTAVRQFFLVADRLAQPPVTVASRWPVANEHVGLDAMHLGKLEALVQATAVTGDDFCAELQLSRLDFMKIDVDGHEFSVLRGFQGTLEKYRPCILVELAPFIYADERDAEFAGFVGLLARLGYRFTVATTGRPISSDPNELRRIITPGSSINCLLYPA